MIRYKLYQNKMEGNTGITYGTPAPCATRLTTRRCLPSTCLLTTLPTRPELYMVC